jgi:short-subunit dehydrogenase
MKVLITGGSQGIGLAIAQELHAAGHELFLAARNPDRLKRAVDSFHGRAQGFACDLSDPARIAGLTAAVGKSGFSPEVLVLCAAGFGSPVRSVVTPPADELRRLFETNVLANYELVQAFLPKLRCGPYPRIILIGSTASIRPDDRSLYGITKWALRSYAYSLRSELKEQGVGVTLLNPGGTFTQKRVPDEHTAPDRLLESSDIAKLVSALLALSPQAVVEELDVRPMLGDTY